MDHWRRRLSEATFTIALTVYIAVVALLIRGMLDFYSRPLVPTGVSVNVDLVVRAMQLALQFAAMLFAFITLVVGLLGFIGYKSMMERTQELLERKFAGRITELEKLVTETLHREASAHAWRSEAKVSGRLGYLGWRVAETSNLPEKDRDELLDFAIIDTLKALRKCGAIANPTPQDVALMAQVRGNLAYYHARRYELKGEEGDKLSALTYAVDALDHYRKYRGAELEYDVPFGAEEWADTRIVVLLRCDGSAAAKLEVQRICEMLDNDLRGKSAKAKFLAKVASYKRELGLDLLQDTSRE